MRVMDAYSCAVGDAVEAGVVAAIVGRDDASHSIVYRLLEGRGESDEISPEEVACAYLEAGIPVRHLVHPPNANLAPWLALAREGYPILMWVRRGHKPHDREWWDLDICSGHHHRLLRWTPDGALVGKLTDVLPFWTGHMLVVDVLAEYIRHGEAANPV